MLPRAAPRELAALSLGPVCALLVVTSVFSPYAPNGNLRWGFWVLAFVYGLSSLVVLRARTMGAAVVRSLGFGVGFAVTGCLFVWISEPASRIDGVRVYAVSGHVFTGACVVVVTTLLMLAVAFPILRVGNARALDHGEGYVTAYGTMAILFVGFVVHDGCLGNRRADAPSAALALPAIALLVVLVCRARRFVFWRRALRGEGGLEVRDAGPAERDTPLLFRGIDGDRCVARSSPLGYREGGMRVPLARVPVAIPARALAAATPLVPLAIGLVSFLSALAQVQTFGLPAAVASYAGSRSEVYQAWDSLPSGWKSWRVRTTRGDATRDDDETLVALDPSGQFLHGKALVARLATTDVRDDTLASVALLALRRHHLGYAPTRPPCARPKDERFEHREGGALVLCGTWRAPREGAPLGLHVERLRVDLATGEMTTVEEAWMPDDGSTPSPSQEDAGTR